MSNTSSLAETVEAILKELKQAGLQRILAEVKKREPSASKHTVRKILTEGGFAEQSLGEVTIVRQGTTYKKRGQTWAYKDQRAKATPVRAEPSLEVMIMPRRPRTSYRLIEEIEHGSPENIEFQDLQVTVRNCPVRDLQAKVSFDDGGIWFKPQIAFYLDWGKRRMLDFLANQTDRVQVWLAYKIGGIEKIFLNVWAGAPIILPLKEIYQREKPYIDLNLQFVGEGLVDNKPREYRLNAQSWNAIGLTERTP